MVIGLKPTSATKLCRDHPLRLWHKDAAALPIVYARLAIDHHAQLRHLAVIGAAFLRADAAHAGCITV